MKSLAIALAVTLIAQTAFAQPAVDVPEPGGLGFAAGAVLAYLAARALRHR